VDHTFTDGMAASNVNIPVTSVVSDSIQGAIGAPLGAMVGYGAFIDFGDGVGTVLQNVKIAPSFDVKVPVLAGAKLSILGVALTGPAAQTIAVKFDVASGTSGLLVDVPTAALPQAPADAATGVTASTPFTWMPASQDAVYAVSFILGNTPYFIFTADRQVQLDVLAGFGVMLPSNAGGKWNVFSFGPYTSLDQLTADASGFDAFAIEGGRPPVRDSFLGLGGQRTFTTAP
jgi:hypothetical protein